MQSLDVIPVTYIDTPSNYLTAQRHAMTTGDNVECVRHPALRDAGRLQRYREAREKYHQEILHPTDNCGVSYAVVTGLLVLILLGAFKFAPLPASQERNCKARRAWC